MSRRTETSGITLMELLVAIGLLGLLLALGVPAFRGFVADSRLATEARRLASTLDYARAEAQRRNRCVRVAASSKTAGVWEEGWKVTAATDTGCTFAATALLREEAPLHGTLRLRELGGASTVRFRADGTLGSPAAGSVFELCDQSRTGETGRRITVTPGGRVAIAEVGCP